jgi:hypothetical protein
MTENGYDSAKRREDQHNDDGRITMTTDALQTIRDSAEVGE